MVDNAVVAIVSEAVHAAAFMVKIAGVDLAIEQSLAEFFALILDSSPVWSPLS